MGEVSCSPLAGPGPFDGPKVYRCELRTSRRDRTCEECRDPIAKGDRYRHERALTESWGAYDTCLSCAEIRDHFSRGTGWIWGWLWEDLEANFFPHMRAGGPCMEGLSPGAKARLFERCLAWRLR